MKHPKEHIEGPALIILIIIIIIININININLHVKKSLGRAIRGTPTRPRLAWVPLITGTPYKVGGVYIYT